MNKQATDIAKAHIQKMNPSLWDGTGEQPAGFDNRIATYPIDRNTELDISFEHENGDGWLHLCELRDKHTGELLEMLHGYGIDSPLNLEETIAEICEGRLAPVPSPNSKQESRQIVRRVSSLYNKFWRSFRWNTKKS